MSEPVEMAPHMALWAFRYVLGRMTYAPSMVQEELKRIWSKLDSKTRETISRDLAEEIQRDAKIEGGTLGSDFDRRGWIEFKAWIEGQES